MWFILQTSSSKEIFAQFALLNSIDCSDKIARPLNMVKPGIQTRRRKRKNNNGNGPGGNPNSKSKHHKHLPTTTSGKEPAPCASEPNLDYGLTSTRTYPNHERIDLF